MDALAGEGARDLVVDLRPLTFIDSSGLHALMAVHRAVAERGGTCLLIGASSDVHRTFEIAGLDQVFAFIESDEVATRFGG